MTIETVLSDTKMAELWDDIHKSFGKELFRVSHHDFGKAIEQAVLQSPEVQMALEDTKRLDWLADPDNTIGNVQLPTECVTNNLGSLRGAIDDARRMSP